MEETTFIEGEKSKGLRVINCKHGVTTYIWDISVDLSDLRTRLIACAGSKHGIINLFSVSDWQLFLFRLD